MIELVAVMMVMGILAAVAIPKYFDSLDGSRVDAAANRIAADLKLCRARAVLKGSSSMESAKFYTGMEKYTLWLTPDIDDPSNYYWVNLSNASYPVDLVSSTFTNQLGAKSVMSISFDMYGRPWCGNSPVSPMVDGRIVVRSGSEERTVVINPVTGLATVQ